MKQKIFNVVTGLAIAALTLGLAYTAIQTRYNTATIGIHSQILKIVVDAYPQKP